MKRLTPLLALFAAGLAAASFATAGRPPGKGNPNDSTSTSTSSSPSSQCHPMVSIILKGTFTSGAGTSFMMNVTRANKHGSALLGPQTIMVNASTKFRRHGHATLADFQANDRLNVQVRACKSDLGGTSAPTLLAKRVVGRPANPAETTTTTTTTASP